MDEKPGMFIHGLYFFTYTYFEAAFLPALFSFKILIWLFKIQKSESAENISYFCSRSLFGLPVNDFTAK